MGRPTAPASREGTITPRVIANLRAVAIPARVVATVRRPEAVTARLPVVADIAGEAVVVTAAAAVAAGLAQAEEAAERAVAAVTAVVADGNLLAR